MKYIRDSIGGIWYLIVYDSKKRGGFIEVEFSGFGYMTYGNIFHMVTASLRFL